VSKDRFGPKFGTMVVSNHYGHDDFIAKEMREINLRRAAIWKNTPEWKKEMQAEQRGKKSRLTRAQKTERERLGRMEAETGMIEAVRIAVNLLEHHMAELGQNPRFASKAVNQMAIHNVIVTLRNKCGVKFEDSGEYRHKLQTDRVHLGKGFLDGELEELRERQREQREAAKQRVIDRLKARPRQA
jgi:hypothetical protein